MQQAMNHLANCLWGERFVIHWTCFTLKLNINKLHQGRLARQRNVPSGSESASKEPRSIQTMTWNCRGCARPSDLLNLLRLWTVVEKAYWSCEADRWIIHWEYTIDNRGHWNVSHCLIAQIPLLHQKFHQQKFRQILFLQLVVLLLRLTLREDIYFVFASQILSTLTDFCF